jgi:hypothetical protein
MMEGREVGSAEYEVLAGRVVAKGSRRVLLHAVNDDGTLMPAESRGGNISGGSRNFRMELDAARKVVVDEGGHPMVVFLKTGSRSFLYQVFGTDSPYNGRLADFAVRHNGKLRKNDNPKCWCEAEPLRREMPELAIFAAKGPDEHDG